MKLLAVFLLVLLPCFNYGLGRISPTPQLHSILDSPEKAKTYTEDDGWSRRVSAEPRKDKINWMQYKATRENWRGRGITMTIIGLVLDLISGALFFYWKAEDRSQKANGRSYASSYVVMSAVALTIGLILTGAGLSVWRSH